MARVAIPKEEPFVVYDDSVILPKAQKSNLVNRLRFFLIRQNVKAIFRGDKAQFIGKHKRTVKVPKYASASFRVLDEWVKEKVKKYDI